MPPTRWLEIKIRNKMCCPLSVLTRPIALCCELHWQGRKRQVMTGHNWTELFFLDEALAMSAGHPPCGYCRSGAYVKFVDAWEAVTGLRPKASEMDAMLQPARVTRDA